VKVLELLLLEPPRNHQSLSLTHKKSQDCSSKVASTKEWPPPREWLYPLSDAASLCRSVQVNHFSFPRNTVADLGVCRQDLKSVVAGAVGAS
jgi:hypothetical protein